MGTDSKIGWTHHTFNPWIGCTKIAPECEHCYAAEISNVYGFAKWGPNGTRRMKAAAAWREPFQWMRDAARAGERRRVFCASLADFFEDWPGDILSTRKRPLAHDGQGNWVEVAADDFEAQRVTMSDVRAKTFALIDATAAWLDWLLLTKRPHNVPRMWCSHVNTDGRPPSLLRRDNVWLGTSAGTQASLEKNVGPLKACHDLARVLFISGEPMLERVDYKPHLISSDGFAYMGPERGPVHVAHGGVGIGWLLLGLESGPKRRDPGVGVLLDAAEQATSIGTPVFVKQDCALKPEQQGRIPNDVWSLKQFPRTVPYV
ncbi:MAG: DUF5131 family protein [Pirellulales bacterium]